MALRASFGQGIFMLVACPSETSVARILAKLFNCLHILAMNRFFRLPLNLSFSRTKYFVKVAIHCLITLHQHSLDVNCLSFEFFVCSLCCLFTITG